VCPGAAGAPRPVDADDLADDGTARSDDLIHRVLGKRHRRPVFAYEPPARVDGDLAAHLVRGQAEQDTGLPVALDDARVRRVNHDSRVEVVDEVPLLLLAGAQGRLRLLGLVDVDARADVPGEVPGPVEHGLAVVDEPAVDAVVAAEPVLHREWLAAVEAADVHVEATLEVVGVDPFRPPVAHLLLHRAPREREPGLVEPVAKLVGARHPDEDRRAVRHGPEPELPLHEPEVRDVGEDDSDLGPVACGPALAGDACIEDRPVASRERQPVHRSFSALKQRHEGLMPAVAILSGHEPGEGTSQQAPALHAEEGGRGQVRADDDPASVEGDVTNRGEVVEVDLSVAGFLQFELAPPELFVLYLQLDLVDLELAQESSRGLVRLRHRGGAGEPRLRLRPRPLAVIGLEPSCRGVPTCRTCSHLRS
jgi:hypothetical protein